MKKKDYIYRNLRKVPKGKVITYKELAKSVGSPNASRFVGTCMKNNLDIVNIPCYKVVKSNGEVGNYSGVGKTKTKVRKLKADGIEIINNKVDLSVYGYKFK